MIKYKIGVAKIKIPYNGDTWLPRNTTKSHRIIKHACIISDIDKENLHVAFFTSWDMFRVQKEYIRNLQCTGKTLKYMNEPFKMKKEEFDTIVSWNESPDAITKIFKISNAELPQLIFDMVINYKIAFTLLPNESLIDMLAFEKTANGLKLKIKTVHNVLMVDDYNITYTVKDIQIAFDPEVDLESYIAAKLTHFNMRTALLDDGIELILENLE